MMHDRAQRRTMQVIEMRVRYQYEIDRRKIADPQARFSYSL